MEPAADHEGPITGVSLAPLSADMCLLEPHRHAGIGRKLIELAFAEAKKAGLSGVSLTTFEEDRRLVDYYRGFGFSVVASRPIVPHECVEFGGNLILMICPVR